MWCSWRTVSAPSGASRYQPLIGAEQATSLAGGLDFEHHNKADKSLPKKGIHFSALMLLYTRNHGKPLQSDFECDVVLAVSV